MACLLAKAVVKVHSGDLCGLRCLVRTLLLRWLVKAPTKKGLLLERLTEPEGCVEAYEAIGLYSWLCCVLFRHQQPSSI